MKNAACFLLACGALAAAAGGFLAGPGGPTADQAPARAAEARGGERKADEDAIRKASAELTAALEKGDAKALAALWTEEGEYVADDGTTVRGRAALEAAYAKFFAKNPHAKVQATVDS